ncbi:asparagine synthetase B, partial [archaeon]|nr:asparagine synthetase B [archaeon]
MCGIIGGNWFKSDEQTNTHLQKIIHRGRDASKIAKIENIFVGHNRLSIQDLSDTANQPMWNSDKTICLVYNGELWDSKYTKDLRERITIPFRTKSDTEIILNGYEQFGVDVFKELDGMFSFAIVDTKINKVFVVRDYVGELPLWYAIDNENQLVFCSEKKGLPLSDLYEVQVKAIYPGTYLEYNYKTLEHSTQTYYTLPTEIINDDRETIVKNIRVMLEEAVKVKMVSDVPICTILSGGIDSVITTYILSRIKPDIEAFVVSMGDGDTKNDDIKYARIAAKEFGVKLHEIILTEKDVEDAIEETLYVIEQSRWQNVGSAIAQIALSKKINELGFKVVFSGDLSDEIWGSYGHIQAFHWRPEDYDKARRKLVEDVHKTNFLTTNQSIMWGGTVEVRTPYSWRPFVEYTLNIPPLYQKENGHMKPLLRAAFKGEISDELLYRPKVYFAKGCRTGDMMEH